MGKGRVKFQLDPKSEDRGGKTAACVPFNSHYEINMYYNGIGQLSTKTKHAKATC